MTENKNLKLNNPCPICNKPIFINEEAVNTKKGIYHLECYLNGYRLELEQEFYLEEKPKAVAKLIEMALDTQKEKFIKEFKFELDNKVISYETLEKLDKIKKSIKNIQQPLKTKSESYIGKNSNEVGKNEFSSTRTGVITSSGIDDHLPNIEPSPADLNTPKEKENE